MSDEAFDFAKAEPITGEDLVVRTLEATVSGEVLRSVDVLITPSGRRAIWNYEGFDSAEEARDWVKSQ